MSNLSDKQKAVLAVLLQRYFEVVFSKSKLKRHSDRAFAIKQIAKDMEKIINAKPQKHHRNTEKRRSEG